MATEQQDQAVLAEPGFTSVLLLYPDYLSSDQETYLLTVATTDTQEAIDTTKNLAAQENDVDDPDDFRLLIAFRSAVSGEGT